MPITRPNIESITEIDLAELRDNDVGEGILIDYKLDFYGRFDGDKKEFLKDVSSFANTDGGHILIGIEEDSGLHTNIVGVAADLDAEMLRLESLLRDRLEPRVLGVRMIAVPLTNGRHVLVIRVPKSWTRPHAVLQNKSRLIFARNSAGVHEASVDEMRLMFNAGADLWEQAHAFQRERMKLIHGGAGPLSNLSLDARIALHIVPFSAFSAPASVNLSAMLPSELVPIWCTGCDYGYNVDGYWTTSSFGKLNGYVQVFRNGIIETAAGDFREESNRGPYISTGGFENRVIKSVADYLTSLKRANVQLPAYIMVSGVRMTGTYVYFHPHAPLPKPIQPLQAEFKCLLLQSRIIPTLTRIGVHSNRCSTQSGMPPDTNGR
jgi:hypothetical protein